MKLLSLLLLAVGVNAAVTYSVPDAIYPADSHFFSVKAHGAVGDGVTDDTAAIRATIVAAHADTTANGSGQTVYFPQGTYLVSDTLWWNIGQTATSTNWFSAVRFEGQNKSNTFIKLADNTFTNTSCIIGGSGPASGMCKAVIYTANNGQTNSNGAGESAYKNDIWNLTINTGSGNPGAVGIYYQCSNRCEMKNVNVTSGDGQGKAGIDTSISLANSTGQGPGLLKNVSVHGFGYGVYANSPAGEVALNYEYIDLDSQTITGFYNSGHSSWIRNLSVSNESVPAVVNGLSTGTFGAAHNCTRNGGRLIVSDATIAGTGGASTLAAIIVENNAVHQGTVFLRNVTTTGYAAALATGPTDVNVAGSSITEFTLPAGVTLFSSPLVSLNLPNIPNTPEFSDNTFGAGTTIDANGFSTADCTNMGPSATSPGDWADVTCYGAIRTGGVDNTSAIQSAMASGRPVIYFPWGKYNLRGTLHIPSTVRKIIGLHSNIISTVAPLFSCESTSLNGVEIRLFDMGAEPNPVFSNSCTGPMVIANVGQNAAGYQDITSGHVVYFEDYSGPYPTVFSNSTVYARQFDIEGGYPTFSNSIAWIFGYKSEAAACGSGSTPCPTLLTATGGSLEVLGAAHYLNTSTGESTPLYSFTDTSFSVDELISAVGWNPTIKETKAGVTRTYYAGGTGFNGVGSSIGLFSGHAAIVNPAPTITSFSASPSSITVGGSSTLTCSTTNTTSVSISPGGGTTCSGIVVSPTVTTTYMLTATGAGGTATNTTTVTVTSGGGGGGGTTHTYYVSTSGNNSNSGLTPSVPWQTIQKVNAPGVTYVAGDFILFKCGDTWTNGAGLNFSAALTPQNAGASGNPITYGNYTTGLTCATLPILDGNSALDPLMLINKNNITVNGIWFKRAKPSAGDMVDSVGSTGVSVINSHFTDTAWAAFISESVTPRTILFDGNTCDATSGHVQLRGCLLIQGPATATVTHNLSDLRNINTVTSGANSIHFDVDGSSTSRIDFNTMFGGTQGVAFKPGSCPTGGTPGVGTCYIAKISGGSMSDNYINGVIRFGNSTHAAGGTTCTGTVAGDGEAIELEGHASPFTSGGVTLNDVSMSGVTVARNIIIGAVGTSGVTGDHACSNDTSDAIGTFFSSANIFGNVLIGPVGTYNFIHFGGRDAMSSTPSLIYNNTFAQDSSITLKTGTAINNQASTSGFAQYRNNIFVGFPKVFCCANTGTSSEDFDRLFNNTSASSGVTLGSSTTTTVDPKLILSNGHYATAEDVKLTDIISPAIGNGQAQLPAFANILNSQPTTYPYGFSTQGPLWNQGAFGVPVPTGPPQVGCNGPCPEIIRGAIITGAIIP